MKNLLLIDIFCRIIFLSRTYHGKVHDKKIADQSSLELPEGSTLHQDKGFQGFKVKGVKSKQAKKKPRGKELSEKEKKRNRQLSSQRRQPEAVT